MQPLNSDQISGTWATVLLPINADDSIDFERLGDELDFIVASEVNGLYSNGTACEFHNQSETEFDRIQAMVAEKCERAGMPFQIGASHPCPQTALDRVRRAAAFRPSAIQMILPDWLIATAAESIDFLLRISEAANGIGLVIYNPPHAKRVLDLQEFAALRTAVPALVGIKVADGNASWYASLRHHLPHFSVFVPGHHVVTGVLAGAHGSYSNVACMHPNAAARWLGLIHSDPARAVRIEQSILAFFQEHVMPLSRAGYSNPALDKCLCAVGGWCSVGTRLRWPYHGLSDDFVRKLKPLAREQLKEFFALA
jgi:4-hydroxy-tetrahydrodipicolinate synthase